MQPNAEKSSPPERPFRVQKGKKRAAEKAAAAPWGAKKEVFYVFNIAWRKKKATEKTERKDLAEAGET